MKQHLLCLATLIISPSWCLELAPFTAAVPTSAMLDNSAFAYDSLLKRAGSCPADYNSCSNEGNSNICCESGTTCTTDAAHNYACCPTGAQCTGTLDATSTGEASTSTTSGFLFPSSTTSTASAASLTGSTMTNAAYPFIYIPTSFANAAICTSYYSLCQQEYTSCVVSLAGQYGVTVGGSGGGVTVSGNSGVTSASAAVSTCSSLSREACYGLQEAYCTAFVGTGSATTTTSGQFVSGNNASARRSSLHEILLALASGILGMLL